MGLPLDASQGICERAFPDNASAEAPLNEEEEDDDESHAAIWAAMPTVIIRDNTQPATQHAGEPRGMQEDIDSETSDSGSSTSASDGAEWGGSGAGIAPSSASTGPGLDMTDCDEDGLTLQDLFGRGVGLEDTGDLDSDLPSVDDVRRALEEIGARRQAIRAIAARYTPVLQRENGNEVRRSPLREIVRQPNYHSEGWIGDAATQDAHSSESLMKRDITGEDVDSCLKNAEPHHSKGASPLDEGRAQADDEREVIFTNFDAIETAPDCPVGLEPTCASATPSGASCKGSKAVHQACEFGDCPK